MRAVEYDHRVGDTAATKRIAGLKVFVMKPEAVTSFEKVSEVDGRVKMFPLACTRPPTTIGGLD